MYEDSGLLCCNAVSVLQTAEKLQTRDAKSHPRMPGPSVAPLWGPQILVTCGCICMYIYEGKIHPRTGHKGPEGE